MHGKDVHIRCRPKLSHQAQHVPWLVLYGPCWVERLSLVRDAYLHACRKNRWLVIVHASKLLGDCLFRGVVCPFPTLPVVNRMAACPADSLSIYHLISYMGCLLYTSPSPRD